MDTATSIALYAAVVGTLGALKAGWDTYQSATADKFSARIDLELRGGAVYVNVTNVGRRPATLTQVLLRYSDGESISTQQGMPTELTEGQPHKVFFQFMLATSGEDNVPRGKPQQCIARVAGTRKEWSQDVPEGIAKAIEGMAFTPHTAIYIP